MGNFIQRQAIIYVNNHANTHEFNVGWLVSNIAFTFSSSVSFIRTRLNDVSLSSKDIHEPLAIKKINCVWWFF